MVQSLKNKKAAFEMSMTTIIVIVLSVVFLILGLGLLRTIFGTATTSMEDIDTQLQSQIRDIFSQENEKIFILLGNDKIAKIRADGKLFSFWAGARTLFTMPLVDRSSIQYVLELDTESDCYKKLGSTQVGKWFVSPLLKSGKSEYSDIRDLKTVAPDMGSARIQIKIPEGTPTCTQEVFITFYDNTGDTKLETIAGSSFTIEVLRKSIV